MLNQLRRAYQQELQVARVPDGLAHRFDAAAADGAVQKTMRRQVVTLELGRFEAWEVVRTTPQGARLGTPLQNVVPKGGTYSYDLIAHVGCETLLRGRKLEDVVPELPSKIPFSSLHDMQHKFLFYFGHLHRQSAPQLGAHFQQHGGSTWLIDGTIEAETPMYFGVHEAQHNILLEAWKIPSENADAITPCLQQMTQRFGRPQEVLHDLSDAMHAACERTWSDVPHRVCHFHLLRDIGEDLFAKPQAALRERVRQLKLQPRMKEQRKGQADWLREHVEQPRVLLQVWRDGLSGVPPETLGREVLLAFHQWILDYARDGRRQGFPFDPYLLYFHRRVARASASVDCLLSDESVRRQAPQVLRNFAQLLRQYLSDVKVATAAAQYEQAFAVFSRLRTELRLTARGDSPMRDRYPLDEREAADIRRSLEALRDEFKQQIQATTQESTCGYYGIVVEHLDRYWDHLFPAPGTPGRERTTNRLEGCWGASKRRCRQRHGRRKLTRDFQSLPADFMLLGNLENPLYVQIVLGELSSLPRKLAEAGRTAGPWTRWRSLQDPLSLHKLPRRLIRDENFIDRLVGVYDDCCHADETS